MVKIGIEYTGDLHCQAIHGPSKSELATDAPVDNQGKGEAFSPTDLVATALGTCIATTMAIVAKRSGIELRGMRIEVTKEMSTTPPRRIARLPITIWMPPGVAKSAELEEIAHTCPVARSLNLDIELPVVFHWAQELHPSNI